VKNCVELAFVRYCTQILGFNIGAMVGSILNHNKKQHYTVNNGLIGHVSVNTEYRTGYNGYRRLKKRTINPRTS
jgi:hypothetical protein